MTYCASLLLQVLLNPEKSDALNLAQWDLLIRQARHGNLLGRLYDCLKQAGFLEKIPSAPYCHLQAGAQLAERQYHSICHEVEALHTALSRIGVPLILLKGAAYSMAGLPAARGRIFSDVDILVPSEALGDVEAALMRYGWIGALSLTAYDQQYYRRWMHELPPMQHVERGTLVDVHHTILPPTGRYHPDPTRLMVDRVRVEAFDGVYTLCPTDMVLHSAVHLFHEGEADNALRDLSDLYLLVRHFTAEEKEKFWSDLLERSVSQGLQRPLWLATHFLNRVFRVAVPEFVVKGLAHNVPSSLSLALLNAMYDEIFQPQHSSMQSNFSAWARKALYIRGHWLRMPVHLLSIHLLRKVLVRAEKQKKPALN